LQKLGRTVASNWRLLMSITLDDYHVVAIHGNLNHIRTEELAYHRFGAHSALMMDRQSTLPSVAAVCRANSYQPTGYQIFNLFPNLAVSLFDAQPYWYAQIQQFVPVSASQTQWRSWIFPADFDAPRESAFQRFIRPVSELIRAPIVRYRVERIARQDHAACEQLQTTARQAVGRRPILGAQELRVAWFDEAYEEAMAGGPRPH
jgi:hypothetical protein